MNCPECKRQMREVSDLPIWSCDYCKSGWAPVSEIKEGECFCDHGIRGANCFDYHSLDSRRQPSPDTSVLSKEDE